MNIINSSITRRSWPASRFFAVIWMVSSCALAYADRLDARTVTGKWRFIAALDSADISSRDDREAQELVGQIMTIDANKVLFGKRRCSPSSFDSESVEPRLYLREQFRASVESLELPNPVTAVELSCTTVFIKNPNKLLIYWDGWFFDAVRIKR